jgi:prepilin-type N-terminal cleavage/methylation domain-containing protein
MIIRASKLKNNDGLTIIELLIAIIIISILAVLATSTYSNYATRVKIANQVSIVTAHAKDIYDLKKDGKNFYLEFPFSTVNEYGTVTKNIGENGENIISGSAEVMIRPEAIPPDSVKWRCIVSGENLSESSIPNNCILGSDVFFRILKDNNMINATENFDLENNPLPNNDWGKIANGDPFLGGWSISGGDEEIELWNNFDIIPGERENVTELDGDSNEIVELSHDLASHNFENMTLTFDYYARTGDDSSNFEVYLGDELVYTHSDFSQQWQSISINLDNISNAESKKLSIREAGNDESYGALIDLDSLKITPGEIV